MHKLDYSKSTNSNFHMSVQVVSSATYKPVYDVSGSIEHWVKVQSGEIVAEVNREPEWNHSCWNEISSTNIIHAPRRPSSKAHAASRQVEYWYQEPNRQHLTVYSDLACTQIIAQVGFFDRQPAHDFEISAYPPDWHGPPRSNAGVVYTIACKHIQSLTWRLDLEYYDHDPNVAMFDDSIEEYIESRLALLVLWLNEQRLPAKLTTPNGGVVKGYVDLAGVFRDFDISISS